MTTEAQKDNQAQEPQPNPKPKTLWHQLLGRWLELLLTWVDIGVFTEPLVMSEPPRADILLLRRLDVKSPTRHRRVWTEAQRQLLPDGVRDNAASHHLVEFKFTESLNRNALQQALGYDYSYRQSKKLKEAQLQTYILSARTPQSAFLQEFDYVVAEYPGVYRSRHSLLQLIPILVLNELRPEVHNAFVQCFASRGRVRRAAFKRLETIGWEKLDEALWDFYVGLQRHLGEKGSEEILMAQQEVLTPEIIMETGKRFRKSLLAVLTPEERLEGLTPEELQRLLAQHEQARRQAIKLASPLERLEGLSPEARLEGLAPAERLAGLAPAELMTLMAQIEAYLHQQQPPEQDKKTR